MKLLFIHQNFPGQYVHVVRHLAQAGHQVSFITQPRSAEIPGVRKLEYQPSAPASGVHAYVRELDNGVANGLAVARLCQWLDRDGFVPDIVIGHNGWGESFTLRTSGREPRSSAISNSITGPAVRMPISIANSCRIRTCR